MSNRPYWNARRKGRRQQFIDLLGGACERCGETEGLHFDHKSPKQKKFRIADRLDAPLIELEKEVKKCRLLCPSCHRTKTREKNEHGQPKARHGTIWMYKKYRCRCKKCKKAMSEYGKGRREARKEITMAETTMDKTLKRAKLFENIRKANTLTDEETFSETRAAQLRRLYYEVKDNRGYMQRIDQKIKQEQQRIEQKYASQKTPLDQKYRKLQNEWARIQGNDPISLEEILSTK